MTTLGQIVDASPEKTDPGKDPNVPYVGLEHIESGTRRLCGIGKAADVRSAKSVFRADDVLYGKLRPYLNKVVRPEVDGVCSTDILVLRATGKAHPAFIEHLVSSPRFVEYAMAHTAGINLPRTSYKQLAQYPVALPPLAEQRRIVERLETLMARSRRARSLLADVPTQLAQARQSLLASAFRGDLTAEWRAQDKGVATGQALLAKLEGFHAKAPVKKANAAQATEGVHELSTDDVPNKWAIAELRLLCAPDKPICYGILMPGPELEKGIPYVRVADFPKDSIRLETIRNTSPEIDAKFARSRLSAGDILLSIRGTVGRVAIVPPELQDANITQDTARLSIHDSVNAEYVAWMLRAPDTQARMKAAVKGVAVRGINIGDVRPLQIPLPPISEQREIVRRLNSGLARLDAAAIAHNSAVVELNRFDQSLLSLATRGELVPQDPAEEPASVLIERLATATALQTLKPTVRMPRKSTIAGSRDVQPILPLLKESRIGLTPEELFARSGRKTTDLHHVETFYAELRDHIRHGEVTETRTAQQTALGRKKGKSGTSTDSRKCESQSRSDGVIILRAKL